MKWEIVKNVNDAKKKLFPIPLPFANRANAKEEGLSYRDEHVYKITDIAGRGCRTETRGGAVFAS